jgi:molecular chaperone GrpE
MEIQVVADDPIIDDKPLEEANTENQSVDNAADSDLNSHTEDQQTSYDDEVSRLQAELSNARDQALRAHAEAQNALRRAERDVEKAHKYGQEKLIGELLVVVDNLERSISASEGQDISLESIKEGVELTLKSLLDTLKRHNVEQVDPEGQPFDPALHQAMTMVPSPNVEPNSVINVFQKGYTLNGRLVRPAMVVVSKAAEGS